MIVTITSISMENFGGKIKNSLSPIIGLLLYGKPF